MAKVNANVLQVGRHEADHSSEERTSVKMTPEVRIGADSSGKLKVENKGNISDHPSERVSVQRPANMFQ